MYEYYRRQGTFPTEGGLDSDEGLVAHEHERRRLFTDKLGLPPRLFPGASLLEFGPDVGSNSLVFALWGARCTLSEPNAAAVARLQEQFGRFGLRHALDEVLAHDVLSFPAPLSDDGRFDVVDAEGFIHTVQPPELWLDAFARLVRPEGFAVVSYYDTAGAFLELMWKVVHARYCELTGLTGVEASERIFEEKWNTIPHRRTLEAWTMDVLENPFQRLACFLDPPVLLEHALEAGFVLHASWPRYDSGFDVHWFKRQLDPDEELRRRQDFIARSRLSHLTGRCHFLARRDESIEAEIAELVETADALVDGFDSERSRRCCALLEHLGEELRSGRVLSAPEDVSASLEMLESMRSLLDLLERGSVGSVERFCASDHGFLLSWGSPNHFAVFRRVAA